MPRSAGSASLRTTGPGTAAPTPRPAWTVADAADDIAAIADALGIDRYAVYGGSGGGPHALANAVRPDRVVAVAALASVAPWRADGLDWLDGMGQDNLDEFGAALKGEELLRRYLDQQREAMLAGAPRRSPRRWSRFSARRIALA